MLNSFVQLRNAQLLLALVQGRECCNTVLFRNVYSVAVIIGQEALTWLYSFVQLRNTQLV